MGYLHIAWSLNGPSYCIRAPDEISTLHCFYYRRVASSNGSWASSLHIRTTRMDALHSYYRPDALRLAVARFVCDSTRCRKRVASAYKSRNQTSIGAVYPSARNLRFLSPGSICQWRPFLLCLGCDSYVIVRINVAFAVHD